MESEIIAKELSLLIEKKDLLLMRKEVAQIVEYLREEISKCKIDADVFVGGSFAKGTLVNKLEHDVDIFVRFDWEYEALTDELEKILKLACKKAKLSYIKLHGSRDYFRIKRGNLFFEIIPVTRIKKPTEARNVTDLSYFHVNYAKNKINSKIATEIAVAKTFCKAQGVYGAESYIQGFSGYALECLLIYYKTFERMLKELVRVKERLILDPAKKYKNKDDVLINLNESKLNSPIILIDPTWKERNVLAALSAGTFDKFQNSARAFLNKPSLNFFKDKELDTDKMRKEARGKKAELLHLLIKTNKQEGDIAGTKLKKFSNFISLEMERYFNILRKEFVYDNKKSADAYFILSSKKEVLKIGPPIEMKDAVKGFRKANKNVFEKNGVLHSKIKVNFSAKRFILDYKKKYAKKVKEMDIVEMKVS